MKACVLIATYNESKNIAQLVGRLKNTGFDVFVVDDGSTDGTSDIAKKAGAFVLRSEKNEGKGVALRRGFSYLKPKDYDVIILMDGDGQHCPDDIDSFIKKMKEVDCGMIIGNRMQNLKAMPLIRALTNKFMSYVVSKIAGQYVPDTQCGFRLVKRDVLNSIELFTENYEIESEMIIAASRKGFKITSVPVKTIYAGQESQINPITDTIRFLKFIRTILARGKTC